jgi:hypothetical protein
MNRNVRDFEKRAKFNGGYDREIGKWKIIDIHKISLPLLEQHEIDFYCCNDKDVYLLRLRNREDEKYVTVTADRICPITYLIAELPISEINDDFIAFVLLKFSV